ncbi:MAG: hypothetical protein K9M03_01990 [Kiritimatiellales bacterium]|nr:hypothetical protein [Kiritimatiellales bacterium]
MITKFTFAALLIASTIGLCPMQLEIPIADHSQMNMDMDKDTPCDDCVSASENNVLKDTKVSDGELQIVVAATIPKEIINGFDFEIGKDNYLDNQKGPNAQAPPLIGTVILRV